MLEAWTLIGKGIGYLGTGLSYFFVKKKRVAALLWPVAIGVTTVLWFQIGAPLLEQFIADTVKIERVEPIKPDSLRKSTMTDGGFSAYAGSIYAPEEVRASEGNVERFSEEKGVPIVINGQVYGFADTSYQSWKILGAPVLMIHRKGTGGVFKIEAPALEERIQKQMKK